MLSDQVLESPNSSYAWIRYMAHHMGVGEIDKARGVAERALKTINFRCSPRPSLFLFLVLHVKFQKFNQIPVPPGAPLSYKLVGFISSDFTSLCHLLCSLD